MLGWRMSDYLLLVFLLFYFAVAFGLPSYRVWKKTGVNPVTFGNSGNAHDYLGKVFKLVILGLAAVVIAHTLIPDSRPFLLPITWLEKVEVVMTGYGLLIISLIWIVTAQVQMGNSWRIGIDKEKQTELVLEGLFSVSRNPIFLGMVVALIGVFFTLPNALTLLFVVLGYVLIQIQVRLEESFLETKHGAKYDEYRRKVRRWL
jgi:protein-S-isoprenylcysteine O-methyltransferase Ste14